MPFFRPPFCSADTKAEWVMDGDHLILSCIPKTAEDHQLESIDRTFFWGIYCILFGMFFVWLFRQIRSTGRGRIRDRAGTFDSDV